MHSVGEWWMWLVFFGLMLFVLAMDMFAMGGKKSHRVTISEALLWTIVWTMSAVLFGGLLWWYLNLTAGAVVANQKALEFFTGFVIEKSLSIDNLFVFVLIFSYFNVPQEYQRRVLLYGVWGAIILRFVMIVGGIGLVYLFHWVLYLFGLFLVVTSVRMLCLKEENDLAKNPLLIGLRRYCRVTDSYQQEKFFVKHDKLNFVTPLFIVLVMIELSDVIFAMDSIPAIFAVTQDAFIIFTSNIFAIMGLRAMYFLLADVAYRVPLLKYGIAFMLAFIGIKMLIEPWYVVSTTLTLIVVAIILITTIMLSFVVPGSIHKR